MSLCLLRPSGEIDDEIIDTMLDLRDCGVDILTLGQYLQPTSHHLPVAEMVTPEKFEHWCALSLPLLQSDLCARVCAVWGVG